MPYTLSVATPETRALVVEALLTAADQRTRVAVGAARKVAAAKAAGKDVRSKALRVTALLAEAGDLTALATELEAAPEVAILSVEADGTLTTTGIPDPTADSEVIEATIVDHDAEDTGLSADADRLADLAGLTPADPDHHEDPVTGSLPEDEPDTAEDVNL